jgi:hypothetical protein
MIWREGFAWGALFGWCLCLAADWLYRRIR